ncbi:MAG: branched-chain amino acid ABC transporter permease [Bacillota bacterium]|nr:branched-chain amino acid ABC transporter permease [Bacillota bacterium]
MSLFLDLIVSAILLGCTYTLVAVGFSLFFGVMDVVVFCCGDIAIFGTFVILGTYTIMQGTGMIGSWPLIFIILALLIIGAACCAALGLFAHRVSIKPFEKSSALMPLLSTIALGTVIKEVIGLFFMPVTNGLSGVFAGENAVTVVSGRNPQGFPQLLSINGNTDVRNIIIIAVTVGILLALFIFLNKTKTGLSMQAISQNKELATMTGINVSRSVVSTFVIGGIILAIGGFLLGNYQTVMSFDNGAMFGVKGFSAAVVGGLRNTWGAIIGGMLLAFVETFIAGYISNGAAYASIVAFVVVVGFIIFKPEGVIGEKTVEKV